ncbi:MAG TPA: response regulator [Pyrinomonadaceae bacterium]|nr:response regulator [Pyrinomonadaceae bacterium]
MLAGRKLLLADDSPTIQKVIELTFADEGVEVISVGSGAEALEKLAENKPDVVLADAFMPSPNGYEICEYIKQNAELNHIPVMLLVGSFEPFDEAEARRVGADEILTKPFQSIRRLIDRVGSLVSGKQDPDQVPTAELPNVAETPEPELMTTGELELTTANTRPLPEGVALETISGAQSAPHAPETLRGDQQSKSEPEQTISDNQMETTNPQTESALDGSDVLLDLGDLPSASSDRAEEFVLDIDLDEPAPAFAGSSAYSPAPAFVEPQVSAPASVDWQLESEPSDLMLNRSTGELNAQPTAPPQMDDTLEWMRHAPTVSEARVESVPAVESPQKLERVFDEPVATQGSAVPPAVASTSHLTPEQIDSIARRAVELLSEKVVQQIAWEVVPQLAELMIKRKLEEKEIQPK